MLQVKNVSVAFGGLKALEDVGLSVEKGKIFSLIGPNGAGKTTLFNVISGELTPDSGQVEFLGQDITRKKPHQVCRAGIARTYQLKNNFPHLTVFENVRAGMLKEAIGLSETGDKVQEILDFIGLTDRAETVVSNLPPLESKLVELARSLATDPKLLLLDELIGGLLASETDNICGVIEILRDKGYTVFQIGHEMRPIMRTSDHIYVLDQGRNIAEGTSQEIKNNEDVLACYLEQEGQ